MTQTRGVREGGGRDDHRRAGESLSAAADKEGARGRHGARPGQEEKNGGRQESKGGKTLGVRGDGGGCEASGVAQESHRVGDEEGGRESSGVAENPEGPL